VQCTAPSLLWGGHADASNCVKDYVRAGSSTATFRRLLCSVVDHFFGGVVDHDGCFEILELRFRTKDRLDCLFKSRAMRFLRSLDVLPEINATTAPGFFIEQKGLVDEVRVSLPT
jgi:hypothetical protein